MTQKVAERIDIVDSYTSRKGQTWEMVGNQRDWQPAEICGCIFVDGKDDRRL